MLILELGVFGKLVSVLRDVFAFHQLGAESSEVLGAEGATA